MELIDVAIFLKGVGSRDSEVNEYGLACLVDHDVVGLDVAVNDADDLVAVMQSFEHVDEEVPRLPVRQATVRLHGEYVIRARSSIDAVHLEFEASVRVVIGNEVDVAVGVVDHLMKPDDVRVMELFESFKLLLAEVAGGEV